MQIEPCPFTVIAFDKLKLQTTPGETAAAANFTQMDAGGMRMRIVNYEPGYLADHWCDIGHFGYVLSGQVTLELKDKPSHSLSAGEAFLVSSYGDASHRVYTKSGAKLLILD
ncbi:MAG: DHCW motif cupin fold protein [Pseudomonadota bacterium]